MLNKTVKALLFMKAQSERVPGKNMRSFCGRPLFHWIMDSLFNSGVVDEVILNTDSEEIANSAISNFNVTIHMRPEYLLKIQSDEANQIMEYDLQNSAGEYFLQTHSTNPLIKAKTIQDAVSTYFNMGKEYDSLFSVTALQKRLYNFSGKGINHDPNTLIKTQDLPIVYEENSCIYLFSRNVFLKNKNRIGSRPYLYPINRFEAIDIDEEYDFSVAESLMKSRLKMDN
jgi:CMP-N-acetylneuraminic acid synthetase